MIKNIYKIDENKIYELMRAYPTRQVPFMSIEDVPNNYLKAHYYPMKRNKKKICKEGKLTVM